MRKFGKIRQYKDTIKEITLHSQFVGKDEEERPIYDETKPLPVIKFNGTVKLHGTNSSIEYNHKLKSLDCFSRTRKLDIGDDNYGFAGFVESNKEALANSIGFFCKNNNLDEIIIYGEWCGNGIQGKVAIAELDKMFVAFAVWDTRSEKYIDFSGLFGGADELPYALNIGRVPSYSIDIDIAHPEQAVSQLEEMVDQVEKVCPFGLSLGVKGIGEGVVFTSECEQYRFKVKGEKHGKRGARKPATIDPIKAASVVEFVEKTVTEDRLEQGYDIVDQKYGAVQMKHLGELMKWINSDIISEEGDALEANQLSAKDVNRAISDKARKYYMDKINGF